MTDTDARVRYEEPAPGVARVVMARAEARNAQDRRMTYELNDAFDRACADPAIKVIVLAGDGPHFSAGHDLREGSAAAEGAGAAGTAAGAAGAAHAPVSTWSDASAPGAEGYMAHEQEVYLQMCWRWRNIPKPTIAEVQGKVIAGALMLVWCATSSSPATTRRSRTRPSPSA